MYMVDAPMLINGIMKLMKPFLSKKMKERIFIVKNDDLKSNFNNNHLPTFLGFFYHFFCFFLFFLFFIFFSV